MALDPDDPTAAVLGPKGPGTFEGVLGPGIGDTLLMKFFADGLSGRLFLDGRPGPVGVLFFVRGEPVHAEPAGGSAFLVESLRSRGVTTQLTAHKTVRASIASFARAGVAPVRLIELLRDTSREMVRALITTVGGAYRFKLEDPPDDIPLVAVNPFGQLLDARRRRLRPDELLRMGEDTAAQVPYPRPGFASIARRIRPFTGGVDLSPLVDGTANAESVYGRIGLPPIIGGLILNTLAETGLLHWKTELASAPVRENYTLGSSSGPLTVSEDAMPLAELERLPRASHAVLSLYFELKPERDTKVLFGADAPENPAALDRGYEERLAQIDPRVIPSGTGRPYLLARAEELREKLERAYRQLAANRTSSDGGAFQLLERIGVGGVAEVYRAQSNVDGTIVAIKRMRPETKDQALLVRELLREARITQRIRHPNVVRVLNAGKSGDDFYVAMDYVRGSDLQKLSEDAAAAGKRSVDVMCRVVADACGGLHAAHTARDDRGEPMPILHRDVSPHNILVSTQGQGKLTDFGLARSKDSHTSDVRTSPGIVRGKLAYLAPELIAETGKASVLSDVYAMGMTLCAVLADLPFRRASPFDTLKAILEDPMPAMSRVNPDIPEELDIILFRACARDPAQRYESALALQLDLELFLARRPAVDAGEWVRDLLGMTEEATETLVSGDMAAPTGVLNWSDVEMEL